MILFFVAWLTIIVEVQNGYEKISPTTAGISVVHIAFSITKGFLMKEDRTFLKKIFSPCFQSFLFFVASSPTTNYYLGVIYVSLNLVLVGLLNLNQVQGFVWVNAQSNLQIPLWTVNYSLHMYILVWRRRHWWHFTGCTPVR